MTSDNEFRNVTRDNITRTMGPRRIGRMRPFLCRKLSTRAWNELWTCTLKTWRDQYLIADVPFAIFVPVRRWLECYEAIQKAGRWLSFKAGENFINPNKSVIICFHDILRTKDPSLHLFIYKGEQTEEIKDAYNWEEKWKTSLSVTVLGEIEKN